MIRIVLLILCLLSSSISFAQTIKVDVQGVVCAFCAQGVHKQFKKAHKPVDNVELDLDTKVLTITLPDNATLSDEEITTAVLDAGYNVKAIRR